MKLIPLTRGKFAQVDDEDYEYLNKFKWCATYISGIWYAKRGIYIKETQETKMSLMHRDIMNVSDRKIKVDHVDHDGLNNQRSNLRTATQSQNIAHMLNREKGSSRFLGVYWNKRINRWISEITKDYRKIHLGTFKNEIEAAKAYNEAAVRLHGEFANPNKVA
jgi:hypothetical protein